ncbi:hypothetical protein KSP39_PZI012189 [Platanthera zijinensis]|uniref:Uncharacterized protein n=1 Tax=Platanthera zijinensis TaxID=2320716 RepID=A0AAP0BEZ9_9ASPA
MMAVPAEERSGVAARAGKWGEGGSGRAVERKLSERLEGEMAWRLPVPVGQQGHPDLGDKEATRSGQPERRGGRGPPARFQETLPRSGRPGSHLIWAARGKGGVPPSVAEGGRLDPSGRDASWSPKSHTEDGDQFSGVVAVESQKWKPGSNPSDSFTIKISHLETPPLSQVTLYHPLPPKDPHFKRFFYSCWHVFSVFVKMDTHSRDFLLFNSNTCWHFFSVFVKMPE